MRQSYLKIASILFLLLNVTISQAQYQLTIYGNDNRIKSIAIDSNGDKWFGTDGGGVVKFDGINRVNYTFTSGLADNDVKSVAIDNNGNKWFATENGVSKFDGVEWTTYTTDDGLAHFYCKAIATDTNGDVWIGTYGGVSKFDGTTWTNYTTDDGLADNDVNSITIDSNGDIWFGTNTGGVSKFDGTTWTTYNIDDGLANNDVNSITIDSNGDMWFGTNNGGASKFDGATWTTYTELDGLADNDVYFIAIENNGDKWFANGNSGVSKFDGTTWTTYTTDDGLTYNYVSTIAIDSNGDKLFGTLNGVSRFNGTIWTDYITVIDGDVECIAIDSNGDKWFGTERDGVSKFDGTNWTTYTTSDGLVDDEIQCIAIDNNGDKWIGTKYEGLSKFDGTTWTTYTEADGLIDDDVRCIAIDSNNDKWFGTGGGGVSKFDGTIWTSYIEVDGLIDDIVQSIAIDSNDDKWFGTRDGVSKFDGTNWVTYTTTDGLVNNDVESIAIDGNGDKWFGTSIGGVSKFDGVNWVTYTTADGLAGNDVRCIAIDSSGNKWFGTRDYGVSKFDGTNWVTYTEYDDILGDNDVQSIVIESNGDIWIGADYGGVSKMSCESAIVDFNVSDNLCDANEIQFANISTQTDVFTKYEWDINNDGTVNYNTKDIEHSFGVGTYTVKLTAFNDACEASKTTDITINPRTVISTQPINQTICENSNVSLNVNATGTDLTYQWQKGGVDIIGQTFATLNFVNVNTNNSGNYAVLVSGCGEPITSDTATLSVNIITLISTQPASQTVCEGENVSFSVSAIGTDLAYQWKKDNVDIVGETTANLNITNVETSDAGDYTVLVSGACGVLTSNIATLSVNLNTLISIQPVSQTVCEGLDVSFNVEATGTDLTYQWYKDGTVINGETSINFNIQDVDEAYSGNYSVLVSGSCGASLTSSIAVLTVNKNTSIILQPVSQTVCEGSNTSISVTVAGTNLHYQWRKDGEDIIGSINANLDFANVGMDATAYYYVIISGECGNVTSGSAFLKVNNTPQISITGDDLVCPNSAETYFTNNVTDNSYQWDIYGGNIVSGQNTNQINVEWSDASEGNVSLTGVNNSTACESVENLQINFNSAPDIQDILGETTACINSYLSYRVVNNENSLLWKADGGIVNRETDDIVHVLWNQVGERKVILNETNSLGCTTESVVSVNVANKELLDVPEIKVKFNSLLIGTNLLDAFASYQWYNEEGLISGATEQFYEPPLPLSGVYYLIATDNNTCKVESNHLLFDGSKSYGSILVYPNPVSDELSVQFMEQGCEDFNIRLFNNTGQAIIIKTIDKGDYLKKISTADLKEGIYFLNIEINGEIIYSEKIIIQH